MEQPEWDVHGGTHLHQRQQQEVERVLELSRRLELWRHEQHWLGQWRVDQGA